MGGGSKIYIKSNKISNAYVGVAVFNLQNMNGAAHNAASLYQLSTTSKNYIKKNNTYSNITSKCDWFFCNDSTIAKATTAATAATTEATTAATSGATTSTSESTESTQN